ncbi:polysaccharide deacetylase [Paenibacillus baekrokdamisoli]|uniref:Polysaccharide deacetylase n=1 Tax=Paenibacillus baekrokdamisoli TaxID=1712516 RepID=A0A3G9J5J0_9BACL|nr:polysaccharide deacetylase family protein [Paenibacillus baekrokdamisoli]MBB3068809.1 peptidoglycan/xylan/chitin deacetylase (PgdA/CDA1 family) [Paenibacillus baekrokdamisoli]BBH23635.1 polysaccharide deacetylase [Paenibacillus baekrokdamisoli]
MPKIIISLNLLVLLTASLAALSAAPMTAASSGSTSPDQTKQLLLQRYEQIKPKKWGENLPGVKTHLTHLNKKDKVIALTFDACGGSKGSGYDKKLIDYLIHEQIPATLFVNARWIDANPAIFLELAKNPLFEIENHGYEHRPLSVTGKAAYGIRGTKNVAAVVDEVSKNEEKIAKLTGRRPLYFRSGTAYYDDVAIHIVQDLGLEPVNYNLLGDAGATYNTKQVEAALMKAKNGSIVIGHMNHPEKDTAEGVMKAIPKLQKAGFRFVLLEQYPLQ